MLPGSETRDFAEIRFDVLLMQHIQACGDQLKRLPHEMQDPSNNYPTGTTRGDIILSYCDLVEHLAELLSPYADETFKPDQKRPEDDDGKTFIYAKKLFGDCIKLCNRKGLLLEKYRPTADAESAEETPEAPNV